MSFSAPFLNPSKPHGSSASPPRRCGSTSSAAWSPRSAPAAGWRAYGPEEMARAGEIVALRALGLSLAHSGTVFGGDPQGLEPALAAHQATLEAGSDS